MFIIAGQDLAANRAFLERVDRPEDLGQRVGVGRDERAPARELGQPLQEREIRARRPPP